MSNANLAKDLKNVSEKDRKQIEQAQEMLGPDPSTMGVIKNVFWGNYREDLLFPYPVNSAEETAKCDQLLAALDHYLTTEHPSIEIDQKQQIPDWVIKKLFDLGVLGMTIPVEFGGLGFGITSYNRILERLGRSCGSTAVLVSAHQSIGSSCGDGPGTGVWHSEGDVLANGTVEQHDVLTHDAQPALPAVEIDQI